MLEHCVRSVLGNPHAESWEIIIADDASSDETAALCQELKSRFGPGRVVVSRSEVRQGAQVSRNRGMSLARGEFVAFVDSDDAIETAGVARLLGILKNSPELDFAYGAVVHTDDEFTPLPNSHRVGGTFTDQPWDIAGYHWHTMGAVYRRAFLESVGPWNEELACWQDWEYQARVKIAGGRGSFEDVVVGYWRHHKCERIAMEAFSPRNHASAVKACESILALARNEDRCDARLERRLAVRLLMLALKWGCHGYREERNQCIRTAAATIPGHSIARYGIAAIRYAPLSLDRALSGLLKMAPRA